MEIFALLAIILFFAAFYRDAELFAILPLTLIILSFLITLFVPNAVVPFIISIAVFLLLIGWREQGIPDRAHRIDVHLDVIETLAKRREKELEMIEELKRRISKEPERSVRDYMDSQRSQHYATVKKINREMGLYCDEIRKNWE